MDRKALLAAMRSYGKRQSRKGRKRRFRRDGKYGSAVVRG